MVIKKTAKSTLTPVELNHGDMVEFTKADGSTAALTLIKTGAELVRTNLRSLDTPEDGAKTVYRFSCEIQVNGERCTLEREVPTQKSFYPPWNIGGLHIWFDGVSDLFKSDQGFLDEKDSAHGFFCKPNQKARFALQDASMEICPERLHPWMPLPQGGLKIENCYRGEDCWMGPYNGILAHGGLDINHPVGIPLYAPIDLDDQYCFNSLKNGDNNNRWRGIRKWDDGSTWILQAHHMTEITVREHTPIRKGTQFAKGGGVLSGAADHSHFLFKVVEDDQTFFLDPWILFWKMLKDQ